MRVRTRHSFAAPFVLVVGCSSGGGSSPERATPPLSPQVAAPADAGADAPAVAVAADASVNVPPIDPCKGPPDPRNIPCNPPPPSAVGARIIDEKIVEGAVTLVADRGARDGVDKTWTAELVTSGGRPIAVGTVQIAKIATSTTELRLPQRTQRVPPEARVRLSPPGPR